LFVLIHLHFLASNHFVFCSVLELRIRSVTGVATNLKALVAHRVIFTSPGRLVAATGVVMRTRGCRGFILLLCIIRRGNRGHLLLKFKFEKKMQNLAFWL
jgi:hypothetical protein